MTSVLRRTDGDVATPLDDPVYSTVAGTVTRLDRPDLGVHVPERSVRQHHAGGLGFRYDLRREDTAQPLRTYASDPLRRRAANLLLGLRVLLAIVGTFVCLGVLVVAGMVVWHLALAVNGWFA